MSIDLVAAALWLPIEPAHKLVLIALCDRADYGSGKCWPGRAEIAMRSSLSLKSVTEHLKTLEAEGWITSRRGNSRRGETTTRTIAVRRLLAEADAAKADYHKAVADRLGEVSTRNNRKASQPRLGEVDGNDQVKFTDVLGEAASLVTVIEQSYETSLQRPRSKRIGQHFGGDSDNDRSDNTAKSADGDQLRQATTVHRTFDRDLDVAPPIVYEDDLDLAPPFT